MHPRFQDASSVTTPIPQNRDDNPRQEKSHRDAPVSGVVIHIIDRLGDTRRNDLEDALNVRTGIIDARFNAKHPHLLLVDYDVQKVNSLDVLRQVTRQNVRAQLVGPI